MMRFNLISGRKASFNIQCLRRQGSNDDLPIPGTYHQNSPPCRARAQVLTTKQKNQVTVHLITVHNPVLIQQSDETTK